MGAAKGNRNAQGAQRRKFTGVKIANEWLSPRQLTVVLLLNAGYQRKEICKMLGITTNTFDNHIARARERLNVDSQKEVVNLIARPAQIQ